MKGRWNAYRCERCLLYTVTIDVDEGVTPFMLRCRASGRAGDCDGWAASLFYPTGERPAHMPAPAWEWYTPNSTEYLSLSPDEKEHVDKGGLELRRIVCSGATPNGCMEGRV